MAGLWAAAAPAEARTLLKTICRVKGQEENTLQGLGIVVGLKGTGDGGSSLPMLRALGQTMQYLGNPTGKTGPVELKDAKNVALVFVTATVPAQGARQGDKIDCVVSSVGSAKSLAGGRLFPTYLVGPGDPKNPRVYAVAEGPITLDNATQTTTGRIYGGCRLEEDFFNVFVKDGKIMLVVDRHHADFQVAAEIADLINKTVVSIQSDSAAPAKALDPCNIEVSVPRQYQSNPVDFVSQVLGMTIPDPQTGARVVDQRAGGEHRHQRRRGDRAGGRDAQEHRGGGGHGRRSGGPVRPFRLQKRKPDAEIARRNAQRACASPPRTSSKSSKGFSGTGSSTRS